MVDIPSFDSEPTEASGLQIGDWWADPAANELRRADEAVRIEPKAMQVLMALADRRGRVVSRDELLAEVWPDVIVGDEALTQSIIKLRRALRDRPRAPAYIETISKRGYRLIAPVGIRHPAPDMGKLEGRTPPPPPGVHARHRVRYGVAAVGIVLATIVAAVYLGPPKHALPALAEVESETLDAGDSRHANLTTVTVLPFEPLGPDYDYLARGISSDLTTDLSRLPGLRLISAVTGTPGVRAPPGVRYVISGSVQREPGTLRINVRLTDARENQNVWSERFERPAGELFAVQDEIVRNLAERLSGQMLEAERQRIAKRYTRSPEAYDYFLRGQAQFLVRSSDANERARALYRKALDLDPNFARAYAGLAMTYAMDYRLRESSGPSPALVRAFELAETARQIDPNIPEVYWALGFVHAQGRRHQQAIEALAKAIELNPSYADAYALMGGLYTYVGQPAKTIPLLRTAMRLNPDSGYLYFLLLGRAYLFEGDVEQALINLREAVTRNPGDLETRIYAAAAMEAAGDHRGAEQEADEIRSLQSVFVTDRWLATYPLASTPHEEQLRRLLSKAGL
jgi:DNA-binding winged helix-turn-helix (wHTH) protein/TolB-like protein/Tfp pilus assembly protein PilF